MSLKEWKNNEVNRLLMEKWGLAEKKYGSLNEEEQIFAPNHYCAHHVRENRTGQEGTCVDHNWNERLQEVTQYDVQFDDGDIRTLHIEELTVLKSSLAEGHPGHAARKEDDSKEHNDEEGNRPSFAKDMGLKEAGEPELEEGALQNWLSGGTTKRAGGKFSPAPGRVTDDSRFKRKDQTGTGNRQIKAASELEPTQEALTLEGSPPQGPGWDLARKYLDAAAAEGVDLIDLIQQKLGGWKPGEATGAPQRPGGPAPSREEDPRLSWNPVPPSPPRPDLERLRKAQLEMDDAPPPMPRSVVGTHSSELEEYRESLTLDEARNLAERIFSILQESKSENRDEMRELATRILAKEEKE